MSDVAGPRPCSNHSTEGRAREPVGPVADERDKAEGDDGAHDLRQAAGSRRVELLPEHGIFAAGRAAPEPAAEAAAGAIRGPCAGVPPLPLLVAVRRPEPRDGPGDHQRARGELQPDHPVDRFEKPPSRPAAQGGEQHARRGAREDPFVDRVDPGRKPRQRSRHEEVHEERAGRTRPMPGRSSPRRPVPRAARRSRPGSIARRGRTPSSRSRHRPARPAAGRRPPGAGARS